VHLNGSPAESMFGTSRAWRSDLLRLLDIRSSPQRTQYGERLLLKMGARSGLWLQLASAPSPRLGLETEKVCRMGG